MIGRTYLEKGEPVVVLVRWAGKGPRNVLIQRMDGTKVARARGQVLPGVRAQDYVAGAPHTRGR